MKDESFYLDFSANINPLGLRPEIRKVIMDNIDKLIYYPDSSCDILREKLALRHEISKERIFIGNGASDLIYKIITAIQRPLKALILAPTFSEYEKAVLGSFMGEIKRYVFSDNFVVKSDFLDYLEDVNIVFLCRPNNPDGSMLNTDLLEDILEKCNEKSIYVVIDESFMDFVEKSERYESFSFIEKYYNLIIIKSFTKIFSFPGLRLAYLVSKNTELLYRLKRVSPEWNVNLLALKAGEKALDIYEEHKKETLELLKKERLYLKNSLKDLGITVYEFYANFILFKSEKDLDLYEELLQENIIIRSCANFKGLDESFYRIAIRKHEDNEKLINALKKIFTNHKKQEVLVKK